MRPVHSIAVVAFCAANGCYSVARPGPEFAGQSSGPAYAEDGVGDWSGPPGGAIDPGFSYEDPNYPGYPAGYPDGGYPPGVDTGLTEPPTDPKTGGYVMGNVNDAEIDATLQPYGEWVEVENYGRVWRPYTTVVGADFTPYETCGTWIYTDYGWTFSCEWDWGWLPFHYGRWAYVDDSWCWTRDYTWGPAWVEWRHGGGYVGWRPMAPTRNIRDHRDHRDGNRLIRDHRDRSSQWKFTTTGDFSRPGVRNHTMVNKDDAYRATEAVAHPPMRDHTRGNASHVMGGRFRGRIGSERTWNKGVVTTPPAAVRNDPPTWQTHRRQNWHNARPWQSDPPGRTAPPTNGWNNTPSPPANAWGNSGYTPRPSPSRPANAWGNSGYTPRPSPSRPSNALGNTGYTPRPSPSRPANAWGNSGYTPRPSGSSWGSPPRSRPSRPSSWSGSRGGSSSPPSRPSSPSRSSGSYSSGSRSNSSYASPSRSSGSSRGSSSGGSRGSSSSGGGGRGRR